MASNNVVFLDRDGVINRNREEYVLDVSEFEFLPDSIKALKILKSNGYDIHVISNQSCVARGLLTTQKLEEITQYMLAGIKKDGGDIDSVNYCTHHPDEKCPCRKPNTGMLEQVAMGNGYSYKDIWFVGDRRSDIEAGNRMGCKTILVNTDEYAKTLKAENNEMPKYKAKNLYDAVTRIILGGNMKK
jgi:D-glycero-D-manno-heptose 1,7-bisphosphate phosphatase